MADDPISKIRARQPFEQDAPPAKDLARPFASLAISRRAPQVGRFAVVSGFPLGSVSPTIQLGLVSAVLTHYPSETPIVGVPKDGSFLLQISVSGNHGNSGGPVIDLNSEEVIGLILQIVPAPLAVGGPLHYDPGAFDMSGIMLAAPALWIESMLARHNIKSIGIRTGSFVVG